VFAWVIKDTHRNEIRFSKRALLNDGLAGTCRYSWRGTQRSTESTPDLSQISLFPIGLLAITFYIFVSFCNCNRVIYDVW